VELLPSLHQTSLVSSTWLIPQENASSEVSPLDERPSLYLQPIPITCDTTRFWAIGVTHQLLGSRSHIIQVGILPDTNPSGVWLLMRGTKNITPTIENNPAQLIATSDNGLGASLWSASVTPAMVANRAVRVATHDPGELNAIFLFNRADPPFDSTTLNDFSGTTKTFTYTFEIPSVATQRINVIFPLMDITYGQDDLRPDTRPTEITMQFDDQNHAIIANNPNLGNGLLMTQIPFTIGPLTSSIVSKKVLTITVETEDFVYALGPRVCRPVYIGNTAWLCSQQAGCISAGTRNTPQQFVLPASE
jgi:hypothetical protein